MTQKVINIMMKIIIGVAISIGVILLIVLYLITHPPKTDIHFDIATQRIISNRPLKTLYISPDSIGELKILEWKGINQPPYEIDINNVDNGYYFFDNNRKVEKIILESNNKFLLKPSSHGAITEISIWTDSVGYVYKTKIESPIER